MKVGLVSSAVPNINGGARFIVEWLLNELVDRGHQVEKIYLPSTDEPLDLFAQMTAFRMIELGCHFDLVVTFRPPAHVVRHPRKVVWFIHHIRAFYDLWGTSYCPVADDPSGRSLRAAVIHADTNALREAYRLFTNSRVVGERIRIFNGGLDSTILYPPVQRPQRFRSGEYSDEIVSVCRLVHHKRQHLLLEAMAHTKTSVRLRLCGIGDEAHRSELRRLAEQSGASDRITIEDRWITEEEKVDRIENALASAYLPFDEDSYGYPTLEAAHAQRCTVTVTDSGGVLEFVIDDENGLVTEPDPQEIAAAFDRLWSDRALARRLGEAAKDQIAHLGISWDLVIEKLLS
jgi:glycosyltransferase involved in cell wall biosynthesis